MNEPTIKVDATPRGCGKLKKHGVYVGSTMSAGGLYRAVVPLLIPPVFEVAPRRLITYTSRDFETWMAMFDPNLEPIELPHSHVLLSHVGEMYSPLEFMTELAERGPSRRISPSDVPDPALLPMPIIFTHSDAVIRGREGERVSPWMRSVASLATAPPPPIGDVHTVGFDEDPFDCTWLRPGFSWYSDGCDLYHPYVEVYSLLATLKERREYSSFVELNGLQFQAGIFCGSWITHAFWVPGHEDEELPGHLRAKGVYRAEIENGEVE